MKKIILTVFTLTACFIVNAQDIKTNAGTFTKPKTGSTIVEVNFSPNLTSGSSAGIFSLPTLSNDMNTMGVKARKFISENKAYRAIANISISNSGQEGQDTEFSVGAGFGIENHFKGAERLSTYWGYEGKLGYVRANEEFIYDGVDGEELTFYIKNTKFGMEAQAFTGFDYYIVPNIYLGVEVSYGIAVINEKRGEGNNSTTKFELAPGITPSFRLGWML